MGEGAFFDGIAARYDEARPGYPPALYERLRDLGVLRADARVLEIGAGTGQATRELVSAGAQVVAVEPGAALARMLGARLPDVRVLVDTFEDAELGDTAFDVAVAATALHWVDLGVGLPKLHRALEPGGLLAVWRTVFRDPRSRTPFRSRVAEIADRRPGPRPPGPDPLDTEEWMRSLTAGGYFEPLDAARLRWETELTTQQVRGLFGTFSDWSAAEVDELAEAADSLGGRVVEHYVTVLCVCRAADRS